LGYLGVENTKNEVWVTCLGYFTLRIELSRRCCAYRFKRLAAKYSSLRTNIVVNWS